MNFGKRVAVILELRGWSQGMLAEKARVAQKQLGQRGTIQQSTISRIINEDRAPGLEVAAAIALALCTSLDWLVGIHDETESDTARTPEEVELLRNYRAIHNEANRRFAWDVVASAAEINRQKG